MRRAFMVCSLLVVASCSEQVVVREVESTCGNGEVEAGEACDDGNTRNGDACTSGCAVAQCGDEITRQDLEPGEESYEACDDGNSDDAVGASATAPWRVAATGWCAWIAPRARRALSAAMTPMTSTPMTASTTAN